MILLPQFHKNTEKKNIYGKQTRHEAKILINILNKKLNRFFF